MAHHLSGALARCGFADDKRVQWLIHEAVDAVPIDELMVAIREPDTLLQKLLSEATEAGVAFAQRMLSDVVEGSRQAAVAKMTAMGLSPDLAEEIVNEAHEALQDPELAEKVGDAAENFSVESMIKSLKDELKHATAAGLLLYLAFFLRGRFLPQLDIITDLIVLLDLCQAVPDNPNRTFLADVPTIRADGSSTCTFGAGSMATDYGSGDELEWSDGDVSIRRGFFYATVVFFTLVPALMWGVLLQYLLTLTTERSVCEDERALAVKAIQESKRSAGLPDTVPAGRSSGMQFNKKNMRFTRRLKGTYINAKSKKRNTDDLTFFFGLRVRKVDKDEWSFRELVDNYEGEPSAQRHHPFLPRWGAIMLYPMISLAVVEWIDIEHPEALVSPCAPAASNAAPLSRAIRYTAPSCAAGSNGFYSTR